MNKLVNQPFLITFFISLAICMAVFFIFRGIMLWYRKINLIIKNQEQQTALLTQIYRKQNRNSARAGYYAHLALGDNNNAHEQLLQMIFEGLSNIYFKGRRPEG